VRGVRVGASADAELAVGAQLVAADRLVVDVEIEGDRGCWQTYRLIRSGRRNS
jgi:hypothetical protein